MVCLNVRLYFSYWGVTVLLCVIGILAQLYIILIFPFFFGDFYMIIQDLASFIEGNIIEKTVF